MRKQNYPANLINIGIEKVRTLIYWKHCCCGEHLTQMSWNVSKHSGDMDRIQHSHLIFDLQVWPWPWTNMDGREHLTQKLHESLSMDLGDMDKKQNVTDGHTDVPLMDICWVPCSSTRKIPNRSINPEAPDTNEWPFDEFFRTQQVPSHSYIPLPKQNNNIGIS